VLFRRAATSSNLHRRSNLALAARGREALDVPFISPELVYAIHLPSRENRASTSTNSDSSEVDG
ncbi:MAG: hypothetical protein LC776_17960, partial [Acidobacteria bacterium]|nr:hypothetical protein [Acidobacteriota bacterium]